jgi:hypothetical protein
MATMYENLCGNCVGEVEISELTLYGYICFFLFHCMLI